jgi:CheY-like chemotaxis protein
MSKILVADDSRFQVALLTAALEQRGFEVVVALDGMQAGMVALRTSPDAIVLDINMPGGSGIEVLKRLKRSTKTQRIPVVVVRQL